MLALMPMLLILALLLLIPTVEPACHLVPSRQSMELTCSEINDDRAERLQEKTNIETSAELMGLRLSNLVRVGLKPLERRVKAVYIDSCALVNIRRPNEDLILELQGLSLVVVAPGGFDGLERVMALNLSNNFVTSISFNGLQSLQMLDLSDNRIEILEEDAFCQLVNLRALDLSRNPLIQTYALPQLRKLEFLRADLTEIRIGAFCRMQNLLEVRLLNDLKVLHCYVFDSLPNLQELTFAYNSTKVCLSMICNPNAAVGQKVPFNFTILKNDDTKGQKVFRNKLLPSETYSSCKKDHQTYLKYGKEKGLPLIMQGCNNNTHFRCPTVAPSRCFTTQTRLITRASAQSTTQTSAETSTQTNVQTSTQISTKTNVQTSTQSSTQANTQSSAVSADPSKVGATFQNLSEATPGESQLDTLSNGRWKRLDQLEQEIKNLEVLIAAIYSVNVLLIVFLLALLLRLIRLLRQHKGVESPTRELIESLRVAKEQVERLQVEQVDVRSLEPTGRQAEVQPLVGPQVEYVPMKGSAYTKLPDQFANPNYGVAT